MLVALDPNNKRVYADECSKWDMNGNRIHYKCPECGAQLVLKRGEIKIPHFAHERNCSCDLATPTGESRKHERMKYYMKRIMERDNDCIKSEIEWPIKNRIADYYCEIMYLGVRKRIAVECIYGNYDIYDFVSKNVDYRKMGVYTLWIFCAEKYADYHKSPDKPVQEHTVWGFKDIKINDILKVAERLYYGKFFALNIEDGTMWSVHLDKTMKGYRVATGKFMEKFTVDSFEVRKPDVWCSFPRRIAQPYTEPWWE